MVSVWSRRRLRPILRPAELQNNHGKGRKIRGPWDSVELKGAQVLEACQGLADLTTARRVVHPADPLLDAHIAAQKLHQGDGWRFTRRGAGHVDAAYAAAGATHTALTIPYVPSCGRSSSSAAAPRDPGREK
jgi:hypothetical protein